MPTPLVIASLTGVAALAGIALRIPYADVGALAVGFLALAVQAAALAAAIRRE